MAPGGGPGAMAAAGAGEVSAGGGRGGVCTPHAMEVWGGGDSKSGAEVPEEVASARVFCVGSAAEAAGKAVLVAPEARPMTLDGLTGWITARRRGRGMLVGAGWKERAFVAAVHTARAESALCRS